ncbi:HAMP domain-containing protein [Deinococcus sp. Arct2-2]|uniref:HAMP domain-containing protein n=1 Tax=Deinococcus sp. Arct2-2 TaxID=2568653 RepID=UPI0010A3828C|nr:HAMP domain-containing protein [Deinococcus sp. Arct2-2]THF68211.1 HAMP domain-containing protein [Deinococcus sp. Arct2-2]
MKYTVIIRQPVSDEVRPTLEKQLMERFGLSGDQAQRLSARRSGRLMKPTGRARADLLMRVFQDVGAQVAMEEVREETGMFSDPFQAVPTPTPALAGWGNGQSDDAPMASSRQGETLAELIASSGRSDGGRQPSAGGRAGLAEDDNWADLAAPEPLAPNLGGRDSSDLDSLFPAGAAFPDTTVFPDPFAPQTSGAPVTALLDGLPDTTLPDPAAQANASANAAAANASADVWSDFTGALTITDAKPREEAAAAETPSAMFLTAVNEESRSNLGARRSLAQQLTFGALAPLALSTAVTLTLLSLTLPGLQRQLVAQNAQAVAVAVGTSLDTRDQETVNAQLDALLARSAVGFVRVELPDGTTYFRGRDPRLDGTLQSSVAKWLVDNPITGTFQTSGSAADSYRTQLQQLEDVGAGDSSQAQELRRQAEDPANQRSDRTPYVVSRLGVIEGQNGQRTTTSATEKNDSLLYRIAVGVPNAQAAINLRNTLLLVLGVSLLALALAAALAVRAARRVVQPIERLVAVADAISMGDLTRPVQADRNDEIGDLAQALERMRLSLEAAMDRLRRRKRG